MKKERKRMTRKTEWYKFFWKSKLDWQIYIWIIHFSKWLNIKKNSVREKYKIEKHHLRNEKLTYCFSSISCNVFRLTPRIGWKMEIYTYKTEIISSNTMAIYTLKLCQMTQSSNCPTSGKKIRQSSHKRVEILIPNSRLLIINVYI